MFLDSNKLQYDKLHTSRDKTVLFDKVNFVVDDCPDTLIKAVDNNLICTSLRFQWNECLDCLVPLFDTLPEILDYIKGILNE